MLDDERNQVAAERRRARTSPWLGLALSGGGIRSATFCLGALQASAKSDLLKHFDYMASVSGGGISLWSGIGVLLRTLLISLFVWLPVATFVKVAVHVITGVCAFYESYSHVGEITVPKVGAVVF